MDIQELRQKIDAIDEEMVGLFVARMGVSAQVAEYKKARDLPILVPAREQEKLLDVAQKAGPEMAEYTQALYKAIFELSRQYQAALNDEVQP